MSSSHGSKKRSQDAGSGEKAQPNKTKEKPTDNGNSPASHEEYSESLYAMRSNLLKFFALIEHSDALIDAGFAEQPFLQDLPPDAPANRRRVNTYLDQHRQVSKLLHQAVDLWMLSFGFPIVRESKSPARKRGQTKDVQESHESSRRQD